MADEITLDVTTIEDNVTIETSAADVVEIKIVAPQGDAATVTVGTTTTGAAGTSASVTNSGSTSAAVLNFTIPRGATGETGATGPAGPNTVTSATASDGTADLDVATITGDGSGLTGLVSAQITDATNDTQSNPEKLIKSDSSGAVKIDNLELGSRSDGNGHTMRFLFAPVPSDDDFGGDPIFLMTPPYASGKVALTSAANGEPDKLTDGTISGTTTINSTSYTYGTGAAAAHRTALGLGYADPLDFSVIALRDEFMGGSDADTQIGQLRWALTGGTFRPQQNTGFGIAGIHTSAARRSYAVVQNDISNLIGGGGFPLALLRSADFRCRARFAFTTLSSRISLGFRNYATTSTRNSRGLMLSYCAPSTEWTGSTVMTAGDYRRPTVTNGRRYYASGGTTSGTEPTWPTAYGATVVDGTCTWTCDGLDGSTDWRLISANGDESNATIVQTGITAAINTWYVIEWGWNGTQWTCAINGASPIAIATSAGESNPYTPYFDNETTTATASILSIDYWGLQATLTRP